MGVNVLLRDSLSLFLEGVPVDLVHGIFDVVDGALPQRLLRFLAFPGLAEGLLVLVLFGISPFSAFLSHFILKKYQELKLL